jgi:hypothetical protein
MFTPGNSNNNAITIVYGTHPCHGHHPKKQQHDPVSVQCCSLLQCITLNISDNHHSSLSPHHFSCHIAPRPSWDLNLIMDLFFPSYSVTMLLE